MSHSTLKVPGKALILAEDAKVDTATGVAHLYFPRTTPITASDKEVIFSTRFGSLAVAKRFRLSEMTYHGRLEL
jgi:hypothetical protein